ncbi:hypothetical protein [Melaminivora sp.]|uniref:hypothetical protein n=1 Tax=Melaminivora sp. TaxID=1933032 RepID=UPI0028AB8183|nr:hypothetical protein [Melaminivora sp.]
MYEIWLVLNILYEIALGLGPVLLALAVVWLALMVLARSRLSLLALRRALFPASFVAGLLFFTLPHLTQSSFDNMGYWVDWLNLLGMALGLGAAFALFAWPLVAMFCLACAGGACPARPAN